MAPRKATLLLVGLLLLTNTLWLAPHEGDRRYTYARSEITVADGTLSYRGDGLLGASAENSLEPVGCQYHDDERPRACAFDRYLAGHGPVSVPAGGAHPVRPEFVRVRGAYYRRTHRPNATEGRRVVVHDVERVSPRTVLSESAVGVSNVSKPVPDFVGLADRIAVTGESVTTFRNLGEDELGAVYLNDGTYYTVVTVEERTVDHGLDPLRYELPRYALAILGLPFVAAGPFERRPTDD